jgi:hypothetical protein
MFEAWEAHVVKAKHKNAAHTACAHTHTTKKRALPPHVHTGQDVHSILGLRIGVVSRFESGIERL